MTPGDEPLNAFHDDGDPVEVAKPSHPRRVLRLVFYRKFTLIFMLGLLTLFMASWNEFLFNRHSEPTLVPVSEVVDQDAHSFLSVKANLLTDTGLACSDSYDRNQHRVYSVAETDNFVVLYPMQANPEVQAGLQTITGRLLQQRSKQMFGENSEYSADVFKAYREAGRPLPEDLVVIAAGRTPLGVWNALFPLLLLGVGLGFVFRRLVRSY